MPGVPMIPSFTTKVQHKQSVTICWTKGRNFCADFEVFKMCSLVMSFWETYTGGLEPTTEVFFGSKQRARVLSLLQFPSSL
jgi:hypothetical protein